MASTLGRYGPSTLAGVVPVVTPEEMAAIDKSAPEPVEELIERAGAAVARAAVEEMGGTYGRRVVVVAGKGNNGADGRAAAVRLERRGVRVQIFDAADAPSRLPACDLVVDAAYGTGFRGDYRAPDPGGTPVLAVDIPSGVDGLTGQACDGAVTAARTVTFAALKPGLLFSPGKQHAGRVTVADIGLVVSAARIHLVETADVAAWLPERPPETHKWKSALWVVAGSPGMTGAANMASRAAMRAGAGTVRLGIPGVAADPRFLEVVGRPLPAEGWDPMVVADSGRVKALVVGPGLGRSDDTAAAVRRLLAATPTVPVLVDADGLYSLGTAAQATAVLAERTASTVFTPHEGEFARLTGSAVGPDRIGAVRELAASTGATVLLKGSTTVVASPDGEVLISDAGDSRLATAGTGDVLSGVIGAFLAQGLDGLHAAGAGAFVHGRAGHLGWRHGLVAGDLLDLLPEVLDRETTCPAPPSSAR
ncbi:MAG: ADP-dependent NAD(P)H-hydrate dehydratase / NAD(P)H-hydrate epimerase [Actinomycetota bacterium]|nr:ADP-dependent NAD(P)H-hydrate dehydratase / NAD(P)H-hydrate epimerase [Actinomycetota bacterium]